MPLSLAQQTIADDPHRFKTAVCGRRFGKTFLSMHAMAKIARHPDRLVWYVAPTYRMAKQIMWKKLKRKLTIIGYKGKNTLMKVGFNMMVYGLIAFILGL